jgi:hypothetical protein
MPQSFGKNRAYKMAHKLVNNIMIQTKVPEEIIDRVVKLSEP